MTILATWSTSASVWCGAGLALCVALSLGCQTGGEAGQAAAVTHTAAMTGGAVASSAYLAQIGAGEVARLPELVETLKVLHAHGPIRAERLVSVSCSGGEAGLMADAAEAAGVALPPIPEREAARLKAVLGPLVTVSNPLDYQTFIWGDGARMGQVFTAAVEAGDAGLFVLDLPRADRCSTASYDCVFEALKAARATTGKPVFAASEREKVLFPDPAIPVTRTRRPIPKAASLIDVSVPQVLYQAHQLAASNSLRRPVVGTNRGTKPWAARVSCRPIATGDARPGA